jgi:hypothetical protein
MNPFTSPSTLRQTGHKEILPDIDLCPLSGTGRSLGFDGREQFLETKIIVRV